MRRYVHEMDDEQMLDIRHCVGYGNAAQWVKLGDVRAWAVKHLEVLDAMTHERGCDYWMDGPREMDCSCIRGRLLSDTEELLL